MKKYLVRNTSETLGRAETFEDAKALCEQYMKNGAEGCGVAYELKRILSDGEVTGLIKRDNMSHSKKGNDFLSYC